MQNPMDQFLSAMRGLEGVKTPLSVETPTSTGGTQETRLERIDPKKMTPQELAEYWNDAPLSEE